MRGQKYPQTKKTNPRRCLQKRQFASRREAIEADNCGLSPYRCNVCDKWHLTSQVVEGEWKRSSY